MTGDRHVTDDKHLVFDVNTVEEALALASQQWGVPAVGLAGFAHLTFMR